jgi:hypothetical protein
MTDHTATLVRYRVRPGRADENAALVCAVYEELQRTRPQGLRYATYRLEDGLSFVHLADHDAGTLHGLPAFRAFQAGIGERLEEPPVLTRAQEVGSYRPPNP